MAAYGKIEYWDERYTKDPEPFEWYQRYSGLKETIRAAGIQTNQRILMIGAGNSRLSEEMYDEGYKNITNMDSSAVVITAMKAKYSSYPGLTYEQGNVLDMKQYKHSSFPVVMDKALLDSILCGDNSAENIQVMLREVSRVLEPGGMYFCVSYGEPNYRLSYLQRDELSWAVKVQTVQKPINSVTSSLSTDEMTSVHYIYICTKYSGTTEGSMSGRPNHAEAEVPEFATPSGDGSLANEAVLYQADGSGNTGNITFA